MTNWSHTEAARGRIKRQRLCYQTPLLAVQEQGSEWGGKDLEDRGYTDNNILTGIKSSENSAHHTFKTPRLDWEVESGLKRNLWA